MSFASIAGYNLLRPSTVPTTVAGTVSGSLGAGAYLYKVTYVSPQGETNGSDASTTLTTGTGSMTVTIPVCPDQSCTARKLYRTASAGSTYLLVATVSDNTTTTYSDIIADGSRTTAIPTFNTAPSKETLSGYIQLKYPTILSLENAITATAGGGQTNGYQLTKEINFVSTVGTAADSVKLPVLSTDMIGQRVTVRNKTATALGVFPSSGQTINAGSADAVYSVTATTTINFIATAAADWTTM